MVFHEREGGGYTLYICSYGMAVEKGGGGRGREGGIKRVNKDICFPNHFKSLDKKKIIVLIVS